MNRVSHSSLALAPLSLAKLSGPRPNDHLDVGLVGDVLLSETLLNQFERRGCGDLRDTLWRPLADCSLIVANLEAPITQHTQQAESKAYNLKTSRRALDVFSSRFVLSLANNHMMDFGPVGLLDTLAALDSAGLAYAGAGRDLEQARAPCYKTINGMRVAVIGAADPRFQSATKNTPGTNPAIREPLVESILEARIHARFITVTIHMGLEYADMPSSNQILLSEACLAAGAHVVQFHHSHCLSGCAGNGSGVVLFGTGNYVFPQVTAFDAPKTKRTGAWIARYSTHEDIITSLGMAPALIDHQGLPVAIDGIAADFARKQMNRLSHRILAPYWRIFWRVYDLFLPGFLLPTFLNIRAMLRHQGLWCVARSLFAGVKAQVLR